MSSTGFLGSPTTHLSYPVFWSLGIPSLALGLEVITPAKNSLNLRVVYREGCVRFEGYCDGHLLLVSDIWL